MSTSRTLEQIEASLDQEQKLMFVHKTNGNYADAEKSRLKIEQHHKDHEARSLYQMQVRHKSQQKGLSESNSQQHAAFNDFWNKKQDQIRQQEEKMQAEMLARHRTQQSQTRKQLEHQHSPKVKESSELLNLRKMEEHMVKQQNFAQAHKVQQQILQRQKREKGTWMQRREEKIQTALATLRGRQSVELANLKMRYKSLLDECLTDKKMEEEKLLIRHNNLHNDLKSQQDKEVLNYKGQFRSKGGRESPMRTRSSFNSQLSK